MEPIETADTQNSPYSFHNSKKQPRDVHQGLAQGWAIVADGEPTLSQNQPFRNPVIFI